MRSWWPLVAVCLGTFMLLVDVTIVNVALPATALDLQASFASLQWVVDGYALALAALLLGAGGLADTVGHRRVFVAGTVVFTVASLGCGLAPSAPVLVAARIVQGVGGAAMIATTFALLNASYDGADRSTAYGVWGAVAGASSAVGPLLGGPLTQFLSWRAIFFVNLPVGVVTLVLAVLVLGEPLTARRRVDVAGTVVFSAAIAALTFGMIRANESGWSAAGSWGPLLAGGALLVGFAVLERRVRAPLFEPALLRRPVLSGVLLAALLLNSAAYVSLAYTSIWMQSVLGVPPVTAGLVALPMSGAAFVASLALGRVLHRLPAGRVVAAGLLLIGLGDLLGAVLVETWGSWEALLPGFLLVGVGVGLSQAPLSATGTAAVPPERGGMAGGAVYTARQVGVVFGIALLGGVFTGAVHHTLAARGIASDAVAHDVAGGRGAAVLAAVPAAARSAVEAAVTVAAANGVAALLAVAGIVGLVGAAATVVLVREPRAHRASAAVSRSSASREAGSAPR